MPREHENQATQKQVFDTLTNECRFQELLPANKSRGVQSVAAELLVIHALAAKSIMEFSGDGEQAALDVIRQIAGTCVRCLEHHGVPARVW